MSVASTARKQPQMLTGGGRPSQAPGAASSASEHGRPAREAPLTRNKALRGSAVVASYPQTVCHWIDLVASEPVLAYLPYLQALSKCGTLCRHAVVPCRERPSASGVVEITSAMVSSSTLRAQLLSWWWRFGHVCPCLFLSARSALSSLLVNHLKTIPCCHGPSCREEAHAISLLWAST